MLCRHASAGIVGSIPWVAMTWFTTWLQVGGRAVAAPHLLQPHVGCHAMPCHQHLVAPVPCRILPHYFMAAMPSLMPCHVKLRGKHVKAWHAVASRNTPCHAHAMAMQQAAKQPFMPPFMQLLGFSDLYAASLVATFSIGCALGGLLGEGWFMGSSLVCMHMQGEFQQHVKTLSWLRRWPAHAMLAAIVASHFSSHAAWCLPAGGTLGDRLGRRLPNSPHGRVLVNQFSVLIGMPMSFVLLKGGGP